MTSRRAVLGAAAAGMATAMTAIAKEHGSEVSDSVATPASAAGLCATCKYWGGIRRVSADKQTVYSESLGWCNNSTSPNFQKKTTPISGPMKMWEKWEALEA